MSTNRRQFLSLALAAPAAAAQKKKSPPKKKAAAPVKASPPRKPNIIWIMADDLGIGDLGCYGQQYIRTPNIDRLAGEGLRFTDAYAGCTVCAPSRSVLMTGRHMGHTSVRSNPGGVPLLAGDVTVAEVLKSAGYATGGFGKWGLGDVTTEGVPEKQGFDEFFGYYHQVHAHFFYPEYLVHNSQKYPLRGNLDGRRATYSHDVIAEKALDFVRRNHKQPFFCYMPFTIPHLELLVPEDSLNEYKGRFPDIAYTSANKHYADQEFARAAYAGMVTRLDRDVGRLMALLTELAVDGNTIVFFTSDNGGATLLWGDNFFRSTLGYRGHKQNFYEGGIRTPMIARWPKRIAPGTVSAHRWYFADFLPTAAELSGAKAPAGLDGISVVPALLGEKAAGRKQQDHEFMYWELPRHIAATGGFRQEIPMQAARWGDWKAVRPLPDGPLEIYNTKDDPGETRNLAAERRDVLAKFESYLRTARSEPRKQTQPPYHFGRKS